MPSKTTMRPSSTGGRSAVPAGTATPGVGGRPVQRDQIERVTGTGEPATPADGAAVVRLHRLVLATRVAALEAQLEQKQRELDVVRSQYERLLDSHGGAEGTDSDDAGGFFSSLLG